MCGISGFIGKSKNLNLSFRLITELFSECEIRGIDASGFWGTETNDGNIVYYKEPTRSSIFVKKDKWNSLNNLDLNLLLVHARGASLGSGHPQINKNNHPFTSTSKSIGLIHNGKIPDSEYNVLTKKYEVDSECDSEILLRIFESAENNDRLAGIQDIWSYIDKGHMAVAIGERIDTHNRKLFLFRNQYRSLWLFDVRKELGQVFFASTPEIWDNAYIKSDAYKFIKNVKKIELPPKELWMFDLNADDIYAEKIKKYSIESIGKTFWKYEGELIKIPQNESVVPVIPIVEETNNLSVHELCNNIKYTIDEINLKSKDLNQDELLSTYELLQAIHSDLINVCNYIN